VSLITALAVLLASLPTNAQEQRNDVSFLRGPYNNALFNRHNRSFRVSAALHFSHAKQHDVLLLTKFAEHEKADADFEKECVEFVEKLKARTEPSMEYYAPYTARAFYRIFRTIDWTHIHHEQTYDIMSTKRIPWNEKKRWTDRAVRYYLEKSKDVAFSPAPLDVMMRRAAVMMKPYFTLFRNYYPKSNNFFYGAHWWHPAIYETQMIGGNQGQDETIKQTDETFYSQVLNDRPQRMLLLREVAPRYSRLSPESANIFDNLHMFHGIVYDILAYEGWTLDQKRAELYRVIEAMRYHPGDEHLARKFRTPHPEMDPRVYENWMKGTEGEMSRIMMEMMMEMMPMMMPDSMQMSDEMKQMMMTGDMQNMQKMLEMMSPEMRHVREMMMEQFKMKMMPGLQQGELPGSLHDAMMKVMPNMKMMPEAMEPGKSSQMMVDMMLKGWRDKYGNMPDIELMPMDAEPTAPPPLRSATNMR